jgi:DNA repair exonuclease SbcCD nuclease subunit
MRLRPDPGYILKLLHTADWQLGLRLNFVGGDAAARLRSQRFDTVRRLGELAREQGVDAVLVAGDVFDDNGVGADTVQQARDALGAFGDLPVILLPGNHDPGTPDSALSRLAGAGRTAGAPLLGANVQVALQREPIVLPGLTIYPCPLTARHDFEDPARWLPSGPAADCINVVLAHGGARDFGEADVAQPNRIDVEAILARGYDYVALGDWHGLYEVAPRAWYSGAPEATRFKEKLPGYALLVEIDAPGATPRITPLPVARTRWLTRAVELFEDADLDALEAWFEGLEEKSWTLVEMSVRGQLSLAGHARLDGLLEDFAGRLAALRTDTSSVSAAPSPADLATLAAEGYLGRAIEALREGTGANDTEALRLLYRLMQENA